MYPRRVRPMRAAFLLLAGLAGAALGSPAPVSHAAASLTDAVWVAFRCKSDGGCVKGTAFHVGGAIFYTNAHVTCERIAHGPLSLARATSPHVTLRTATVGSPNRRPIGPASDAPPSDA